MHARRVIARTTTGQQLLGLRARREVCNQDRKKRASLIKSVLPLVRGELGSPTSDSRERKQSDVCSRIRDAILLRSERQKRDNTVADGDAKLLGETQKCVNGTKMALVEDIVLSYYRSSPWTQNLGLQVPLDLWICFIYEEFYQFIWFSRQCIDSSIWRFSLTTNLLWCFPAYVSIIVYSVLIASMLRYWLASMINVA